MDTHDSRNSPAPESTDNAGNTAPNKPDEIIIQLEYGFTKKVVQRRTGSSAGKYDVYIYSPTGKRFHSRKSLMQYLKDHCPEIPSKIFNEAFYFAKNLNSPHRARAQGTIAPNPSVESRVQQPQQQPSQPQKSLSSIPESTTTMESNTIPLQEAIDLINQQEEDDFQKFSKYVEDNVINIYGAPVETNVITRKQKNDIIVDFSDDENEPTPFYNPASLPSEGSGFLPQSDGTYGGAYLEESLYYPYVKSAVSSASLHMDDICAPSSNSTTKPLRSHYDSQDIIPLFD